MKDAVYENYTSTSMFIGFNEAKLSEWSVKYFKHQIFPHLPKNRGVRILEVGCGYGRYVKTMVELGYTDVRGIDVSEEQINYAQEILGLRNVQVADAVCFLDNCDDMYDVIIVLDVLEHLEVEYSIGLIKKIKDRLIRGGILVIQVPNGISPLSVNLYGDITHKRAYSSRSMEQSLKMGGFEDIQCYPLPPFSWDFKSLVRAVLWRYLLNPMISVYLRVAVGGKMGGIYTENILSVSTKH